MTPQRKAILIRALCVCIAAAILLVLISTLTDRWEKSTYREEPRQQTALDFFDENVVVWEGVRYRKTPAVSTYLIAGVDKESDAPATASNKYRNGGQADYLLLLTVDHTNRKIYQLQLDRDTMTDVTVLSVYGKETGTRVLQLCLAHSYGSTKDDNARYTVQAVRRLLQDIEIAGYYIVNYTAVPVLNDALGGVTVTIPDDMTEVNPQWTPGAKITLQGKEAESFVRARKTVGHGTNAERMRRQHEFTSNAILLLNRRLSENADFAGRLLAALRNTAATNISQQQLLLEINEAHAYDIQPVEYLRGEYVIADNGFAEFHADENSISEWIMNRLYTRE